VAGAPQTAPNRRGDEDDPRLSLLLSGIVGSVETLIRQEIALVIEVIHEEFSSATQSTVAIVAASAILVLGVALFSLGAAIGVSRLVHWPAWGGFVAVGGVLAIIGTTALRLAVRRTPEEAHAWPKHQSASDS
jgi:uncharacterized membrane protein YgdD (TMEM256/DUF423 family)